MSALAVSLLGACTDPVSPVSGGLRPPAFAEAGGAPYEVTVTDLRPLGLDRTPVDINERGEMVGNCPERTNASGVHNSSSYAGRAFLWSAAAGLRDLGTLGGTASCAAAVNDLGQVVGYSRTATEETHAFVWTAEGGMRDLGTLPGHASSRALDINNRGEIVGISFTDGFVAQAVRWTPDGTIESLGQVPPRDDFVGGESRAVGINEAGQIVGRVSRVRGNPGGPILVVFLWTEAEGMRTLIPPRAVSDGTYVPAEINNRGVIVGAVYDLGGNRRAFALDTTGAAVPLNIPFGPASGRCGFGAPVRINDAGVMTGSCAGTFEVRGFVASEAIGGIELPAMLPGATPPGSGEAGTLAYGLNERGEIVGSIGGWPRSNAVLWTLRATSSPPSGPALVVSRASGKCMDVYGAGREPGTPVIIWPCHEQANQRWTLPAPNAAGEIRIYGDLCLDANTGYGNDGDAIIVWPCHGRSNQQWALTERGELKGISGKCVDVAGARTDDLTELILWPCHGGSNQLWDVRAPSATVAAASFSRGVQHAAP